MTTVSIEPVAKAERAEFLRMALQYFRELNPAFHASADWQGSYFERVQANSDYFLRWIVSDDQRQGFILFGMEDHHFLPRKAGVIWELYVVPQGRRKGIARKSAQMAIEEMSNLSPTKIRLDVVKGNDAAVAFWESLGFRKTAECFVLAMPGDSWR